MNRLEINAALHDFVDRGLFTVNFDDPTYQDLLDDLEKLKPANPFILFGIINHALS